MDNDLTQNQHQQDQEIANLERQLSEAVAASGFFELEVGRLFQRLATLKINKYTRDILSDKYDNDHRGYNNAKSHINAYQDMLKMMQRAGRAEVRDTLKERLNVAAGK